MVREFPVFHPPAAGTHGWDGSSNGFHPAASVKAQVDNVSIDFNFVYPPALISCGNYRPIPTLGFFFGDNPLKNPFTLLLLEVSFIILTTRVLRFLLKPLKQPRIVSEVIVSSSSSHNICLSTKLHANIHIIYIYKSSILIGLCEL